MRPSSPSLESRVEAARDLAKHPRIAVTGFEAGSGSAYTIDLLAELKRRFPGVSFVWLMGADNLAQFDRWRAWEEIFAAVPIAVLDRPGLQAESARQQGGTALRRLPGRRIRCARAGAARASGLDHPHPHAVTALLDRAARQEGQESEADKAKGKDKKPKKKAKRH